MRRTLCLATAACLLTAGALLAQDGPALLGFNEPLPAPGVEVPAIGLAPVAADPAGPPVLIAPTNGTPVPMPETACVLYDCVVYRHPKNVHPCAMPVVVAVKHPCLGKRECPCEYVNVQICLPPCECSAVKIKKCASKVIYRYGKYAVEITSKNGRVIVSYHA